jgi:hypothetical protein
MTETENRSGLIATAQAFHDACVRIAYAPFPAGALPEAHDTAHTDAVFAAQLRCLLPHGPHGSPASATAILARVKALLAPHGSWDSACISALSRFDAPESLAQVWIPALAEERRVLEAYPANSQEKIQRLLNAKRIRDERLLKRFSAKHREGLRPFSAMDTAAARDYFWSWSQSAFGLKRRFHRACRDVISGVAVAAPELRGRKGF